MRQPSPYTVDGLDRGRGYVAGPGPVRYRVLVAARTVAVLASEPELKAWQERTVRAVECGRAQASRFTIVAIDELGVELERWEWRA